MAPRRAHGKRPVETVLSWSRTPRRHRAAPAPPPRPPGARGSLRGRGGGVAWAGPRPHGPVSAAGRRGAGRGRPTRGGARLPRAHCIPLPPRVRGCATSSLRPPCPPCPRRCRCPTRETPCGGKCDSASAPLQAAIRPGRPDSVSRGFLCKGATPNPDPAQPRGPSQPEKLRLPEDKALAPHLRGRRRGRRGSEPV